MMEVQAQGGSRVHCEPTPQPHGLACSSPSSRHCPGSRYTAAAFQEPSKKSVFLSGQITRGILPEIIEKTSSLFLRVQILSGASSTNQFFVFAGQETQGGASCNAVWTIFAACQSNVFCVATRPAAWNIFWKPVLWPELVPT